MIFPDYDGIFAYAIVCGILLAAVWLFRAAKAWRALIRIPIQVISLFAIILCSLVTLIFIVFLGASSRLDPIYSPDHRRAVRISYFDYGAVGGDTAVVLYSHFGLYSRTLMTGEWMVVKAEDVRWISNAEVLIRIHGGDAVREVCADIPDIKVRCEQVGSDQP